MQPAKQYSIHDHINIPLKQSMVLLINSGYLKPTYVHSAQAYIIICTRTCLLLNYCSRALVICTYVHIYIADAHSKEVSNDCNLRTKHFKLKLRIVMS